MAPELRSRAYLRSGLIGSGGRCGGHSQREFLEDRGDRGPDALVRRGASQFGDVGIQGRVPQRLMGSCVVEVHGHAPLTVGVGRSPARAAIIPAAPAQRRRRAVSLPVPRRPGIRFQCASRLHSSPRQSAFLASAATGRLRAARLVAMASRMRLAFSGLSNAEPAGLPALRRVASRKTHRYGSWPPKTWRRGRFAPPWRSRPVRAWRRLQTC